MLGKHGESYDETKFGHLPHLRRIHAEEIGIRLY
jgi:hypothetical protein